MLVKETGGGTARKSAITKKLNESKAGPSVQKTSAPKPSASPYGKNYFGFGSKEAYANAIKQKMASGQKLDNPEAAQRFMKENSNLFKTLSTPSSTSSGVTSKSSRSSSPYGKNYFGFGSKEAYAKAIADKLAKGQPLSNPEAAARFIQENPDVYKSVDTGVVRAPIPSVRASREVADTATAFQTWIKNQEQASHQRQAAMQKWLQERVGNPVVVEPPSLWKLQTPQTSPIWPTASSASTTPAQSIPSAPATPTPAPSITPGSLIIGGKPYSMDYINSLSPDELQNLVQTQSGGAPMQVVTPDGKISPVHYNSYTQKWELINPADNTRMRSLNPADDIFWRNIDTQPGLRDRLVVYDPDTGAVYPAGMQYYPESPNKPGPNSVLMDPATGRTYIPPSMQEYIRKTSASSPSASPSTSPSTSPTGVVAVDKLPGELVIGNTYYSPGYISSLSPDEIQNLLQSSPTGTRIAVFTNKFTPDWQMFPVSYNATTNRWEFNPSVPVSSWPAAQPSPLSPGGYFPPAEFSMPSTPSAPSTQPSAPSTPSTQTVGTPPTIVDVGPGTPQAASYTVQPEKMSRTPSGFAEYISPGIGSIPSVDELYNLYKQVTGGQENQAVKDYLASPDFQSVLGGTIPFWMQADPVWRVFLQRLGVWSPSKSPRMKALMQRLNG